VYKRPARVEQRQGTKIVSSVQLAGGAAAVTEFIILKVIYSTHMGIKWPMDHTLTETEICRLTIWCNNRCTTDDRAVCAGVTRPMNFKQVLFIETL
jgi:hypothetical protein